VNNLGVFLNPDRYVCIDTKFPDVVSEAGNVERRIMLVHPKNSQLLQELLSGAWTHRELEIPNHWPVLRAHIQCELFGRWAQLDLAGVAATSLDCAATGDREGLGRKTVVEIQDAVPKLTKAYRTRVTSHVQQESGAVACVVVYRDLDAPLLLDFGLPMRRWHELQGTGAALGHSDFEIQHLVTHLNALRRS